MAEVHDNIKADDGVEITIDSEKPRTRKKYRVTAMGGLFKHGKQIDKGSIVELDEKTAANFIRNQDVEVVGENE